MQSKTYTPIRDLHGLDDLQVAQPCPAQPTGRAGPTISMTTMGWAQCLTGQARLEALDVDVLINAISLKEYTFNCKQ